ncbi:MAG: hypothetical protein OXR73_31035 [Myxococcales bacterium]|nr:hypothetical protein [Myxococcales bacterium]
MKRWRDKRKRLRERISPRLHGFGMLSAIVFLLGSGVHGARADIRADDLTFDRGLAVTGLSGYPRALVGWSRRATIGFVARNQGPERSLVVEVTGTVHSTRHIRVPAGETLRFFMHLPLPGSSPLETSVTDSLSGQRRTFTVRNLHAYDEEHPIGRLGLLSFPWNVSDPWTGVGSLDDAWPDSWRALDGLNALVIEHRTLLERPSRLPVLSDWVVAGGLLLVSAPASAIPDLPELLPGAPFAGASESIDGGRLRRVGLGAVAVLSPEQLHDIDEAFLERIDAAQLRNWIGSDRNLSGIMRMTKDRLAPALGRPSWTVFLLQLGFATMVGPVAFHRWVRKRRKPLRYVGFVGACAATFSVALLGADLMQRGLRISGSARSLLLIDQRADRELGFSELAAYASTSYGTMLDGPIGSDLMVLRPPRGLGESDIRHSATGGVQQLDGAIVARQKGLVGSRWILPASGRLEVVASDRGLHVENHLGRDLTKLVIWHRDLPHLVEELPRGAVVIAQPISVAQGDALSGWEVVAPLTSQGVTLLEMLRSGRLGGSRYVGLADLSPDNGLHVSRGFKRVDDGKHVVAGVY